MKKYFFGFLLISFFFFSFAQEEMPGEVLTPPGKIINPALSDCFQYYKFGSVYASLETRNYTNISGTKMNFFGEIKNENAYPIVDGKLFVKVMRENNVYNKTGGQDEVDSFVVKEGISIRANSSIPIEFDWSIPAYAVTGEYQISTFFLIDNSFNMSGLPFTTDIVGGVVKFAVVGEQKENLIFDRNNITLNGVPYYTVAFPPVLSSTSTGEIIFTLSNSTHQTQHVAVRFELYEWDAQAPNNLLRKEDKTYLIDANGSIKIPYIVTDTKHSVYYVLAKAEYRDTRSEVAVRFGRDGIQEPRINFSAFTQYPFVKGQENSLITCVHNTSNSDAEYGKVVTSVLDHKGNIIHTSTYEGKITGAIQGLLSKFTPSANYKDISIETKIYDKENNLIDQSSVNYVCSDLSDDCEEPLFVFNINFFITIITLLLIVGIILFISKYVKRRNFITSLLMMFVLGAMIVPSVGEAKSVRWSYLMEGQWHNNPNDYCPTACGGQSYTTSPYFQIDFYGNVKNLTTDQILTDNDSVRSGDILRFTFGKSDTDFSQDYKDIFWFKTGYMTGSPYGEWTQDALPIHYKTIEDFNNDFSAWWPYYQKEREKYQSEVSSDYTKIMLANCNNDVASGKYWTNCTAQVDYMLSLNTDYLSNIEFNVDPPSRQLRRDSIFSCGAFDVTNHFLDCSVNNVLTETPINVDFIYNKTYGIYYEALEGGNINQFVSGEEQGTFGNMKIDIPAQTIPFTLNIQPSTACAANTPPTVPTVHLPTSASVNQDVSITFSSTDTQNDAITYQIDWGDGVITTVSSPLAKSWTTSGVKTIKMRAIDTCGESAWNTKNIVVTDPPVLNPPTLTSDPACGSVVLNWNNNSATAYQVFRKEGDESYRAISPIQTSLTFTDTAVQDRHIYTYKVWSQKGTLEAISNESTTTPTCPCLPPRIADVNGGCYDPLDAVCQISAPFIGVNQPVTWSLTPTGGTGNYTYSWSGTDIAGVLTTQTITRSYATTGTKTTQAIVTSGTQSKTITCPVLSVEADVCGNIQDSQSAIPNGLISSGGNCICSN